MQTMEIADARLLMIPHERHSNQNEMTLNDNIEKSQKLIMPRVDEGKVHMTSIPERVCKIQLPSTGQLQKTRHALSRLHLRMTRGSDPMLKSLIMRSLESILDQCIELRLLPSTIMKQIVPSKNKITLTSDNINDASVRCKRFSNVLAYAQLILC